MISRKYTLAGSFQKMDETEEASVVNGEQS